MRPPRTRPLTRREQSVLRRLGEQLREDDPALAEQLERPEVHRAAKIVPAHWPASTYLVIGLAFLVAGLVLGVGSAVLGGLFSITVALARSRSIRERLIEALAGCVTAFHPPLG